MLLAGQWLVQNTLSVQSVAQRLGYTSQAAFSRAFKRVTGRPQGSSRAARAQTALSRTAGEGN